jgi:hypothetical protein
MDVLQYNVGKPANSVIPRSFGQKRLCKLEVLRNAIQSSLALSRSHEDMVPCKLGERYGAPKLAKTSQAHSNVIHSIVDDLWISNDFGVAEQHSLSPVRFDTHPKIAFEEKDVHVDRSKWEIQNLVPATIPV